MYIFSSIQGVFSISPGGELWTELVGRLRSHRAGCELEVGLCLDPCPSPVFSRLSVSLALQGCEGSRTQRLCKQPWECPQVPTLSCHSLGWPRCHPAPSPSGTVAEGTQLGAKGHKGGKGRWGVPAPLRSQSKSILQYPKAGKVGYLASS